MSEIMRVVIVNDQSKVADMWRSVVDREADMESAQAAYSGEEAVTLCAEYKPHVVVMDVMMPGTIDGIEATRQIVAQGNGTQVIVFSGRNDIANDAFEAGAVKFLGLPLLPDTLLSAIREVAS